jgi:hypothetical protein
MNRDEALELLNTAQCDSNPSSVNPALTTKQTVDIIRAPIERMPENTTISDLFEKRVWQATLNRKRPRY